MWSTYRGHGWDEYGFGLTRSNEGTLYVVGVTESPEYPTTAGAPQRTRGGNEDGFISAISESGAPVTPIPVTPTPVTPTPVAPAPVTPTPVPATPGAPPLTPGNQQLFLPVVQR